MVALLHQVVQQLLEPQVLRVFLRHRVHQQQVELLVLLEQLVRVGLQHHQVRLVHLVVQLHLVLQDPLVHQVLQHLQERLHLLVHQQQVEQLVAQVYQLLQVALQQVVQAVLQVKRVEVV